MDSFRKLLLILIPALLIFAACGGGDDDDSGDDDDDSGDAPASANDSGDKKSSNRDVEIPTVKDGVFEGGSVRLEYSGGKDFKGDIQGNGITQGGYTLLTFASDNASVFISFQPDLKDEPGGISITTKDISTAGGFGTDCSFSANDGAKELKGEFECRNLDAVEPGSVKTYRLNIKGSFTVSR